MPHRLSALILLTTIFVYCNAASDYYGILGVERGCSLEDIAKAFRKLALEYHPDKNRDAPDPEVINAKYILLIEAYEVLSDDERRRVYDQTGSAPNEPPAASDGPRSHYRGPEINRVNVALEWGYHGRNMQLTITGKCLCTQCKGTGQIYSDAMIEAANAEDSVATISNSITELGGHTTRKCPLCEGEGLGDCTKTLSVFLPPGSLPGVSLPWQTNADDGRKFVRDILIVFGYSPHPLFELVGLDLIMRLNVSKLEVKTGVSHSIQHLSGVVIELSSVELRLDEKSKKISGTFRVKNIDGMILESVPVTAGEMKLLDQGYRVQTNPNQFKFGHLIINFAFVEDMILLTEDDSDYEIINYCSEYCFPGHGLPCLSFCSNAFNENADNNINEENDNDNKSPSS